MHLLFSFRVWWQGKAFARHNYMNISCWFTFTNHLFLTFTYLEWSQLLHNHNLLINWISINDINIIIMSHNMIWNCRIHAYENKHVHINVSAECHQRDIACFFCLSRGSLNKRKYVNRHLLKLNPTAMSTTLVSFFHADCFKQTNSFLAMLWGNG